MTDLVVVDTVVLQKANAPVSGDVNTRSKFAKRLKLLAGLRDRRLTVLISEKLLAEYRKQIPTPRNDYLKAFFELLAYPGVAVRNWSSWSGYNRSHAAGCRFPREDYHVLRTAICQAGATILSEEHRMLVTDKCIHRKLNVHVIDPTT
ncbi:MAG: hypothetical protein NTV86_03180 [Planctomycetota bacterium]|nr:hypothetical protein [Planctomycetota bacterium]